VVKAISNNVLQGDDADNIYHHLLSPKDVMLIDLFYFILFYFILFYFVICNALNRTGWTQRQMLGRNGKSGKEAITACLCGTISYSYAGAEKIHKVSVRVATVQAEIWTRDNTYKKRQCHIFDNDVILLYSCCRTIFIGLYVCNLHVMLRATNDFNCLAQERRVTFFGLVEQLIHSDHTFQYLYV
jgi:hypothetical protein